MASSKNGKTSAPCIQPTERDLRLLRDLFECRLMTIEHAEALHFSGGGYAQDRLRVLAGSGLLRPRKRKVNEPLIYFFSRKGFDELKGRGLLQDYGDWNWTRILQKRADVSDRTIRHELSVMDVKAALQPAIEAEAHLRVMEFGTWPALYEFKARRMSWDKQGRPSVKAGIVKPDGFLRLREHQGSGAAYEHDFFLEVDLGNEVRPIVVSKVSGYNDHYRSGGHARRHGGEGARKEDYPFRTLFVFKSAEQRNNFCERLLLARLGATQAWTASFDDVIGRPLGKIWVRPLDYWRAVVGTAFEPTAQRVKRYIRRPEREAWIDAKAAKHALLDDPGRGGSPAESIGDVVQ